MPDAVYPMLTMLSTLVAPLPIGTNIGLLHLRYFRRMRVIKQMVCFGVAREHQLLLEE